MCWYDFISYWINLITLTMELLKIESHTECQTIYFYPNINPPGSALVKVLDPMTNTYFTDLKEVSTVIRIYGTPEQIEKALDDYCLRYNLNVDEAYDFKPEAEGSYFYNKDENDEIKKALTRYKNIYLKKNAIYMSSHFYNNKNRAIIINLI